MDQILLGWLFGTMTIEIASQMMNCKTLYGLWKAITEFVGANIKSHITFLKYFKHLKPCALKS